MITSFKNGIQDSDLVSVEGGSEGGLGPITRNKHLQLKVPSWLIGVPLHGFFDKSFNEGLSV